MNLRFKASAAYAMHHASKVVISLQPWPLGCTDHLNSAGLDFDVQNHPNSAKFRWPMAGWSFICGHKLRKKCLKEIEGEMAVDFYWRVQVYEKGLKSSHSVTPKLKLDRTATRRPGDQPLLGLNFPGTLLWGNCPFMSFHFSDDIAGALLWPFSDRKLQLP